MMECPNTVDVLEPYVDSELDLTRTIEFERHLGACPECAAKVASLRQLSKRLQASDMRFNAPASMKQAILRKTGAKPSPIRSRSFSFFAFAAAAAALVLVVLPALYMIQSRNSQRQLASELISAHVRSLMFDNHLIDVQSTDQHTVKPWFEGKLDFAPTVNDYADQGYPLAGGRLDYIGGRNVAVLIYHRRQHPINVFEWPSRAASDERPANQSKDGFNLVHWSTNGMEFWAASDLNYNELAAFVEMMRNKH